MFQKSTAPKSFLLNDVAQNTTDCNFIYRGRQLRRVIIQLHYALFLYFLVSSFTPLTCRATALLFQTLLLHALILVIFSQSQGTFFTLFFILSCTLCYLSLFFCSPAVVFGWSWMVSTKPMDLCGVCSVNPVNFTWHNYKRPAQELTRDRVPLRCLTRKYVHPKVPLGICLIHCNSQNRAELRNGLHIFNQAKS